MYIGLPQWQHPAWHRLGMNNLADYSRYFNCVEGNTTFYALPARASVERWRDMTHDEFRFCFKFPSTISHQAALQHCDNDVSLFFQCLTPIEHRIGQLWLQLPAAFGPPLLSVLWRFLDALPHGFSYGVEVRHPLFFAKGDEERELNQGLRQRGINRVILDSRPVHHAAPESAAMREAQRKKPRLPVHAVLTATQPLIRFIGCETWAENRHWFESWRNTLPQWREAKPFFFIHTPDIGDAPPLARQLWPFLAEINPTLPPQPDWPQQATLF
ncbi:DUF72 domain-containing protein [Samsonia erythrinae]|uniref:Uncharacterized protein YecE (DUF72 family) n=1 Tax=Samsonia erythrinae TaxID=160434 RepID=A0A4R3VNZ8_9GAMM|nr:DUF72 domain-containing protein [Samsonia erythrinae]TCV06780.1 uncharacterized protein YecE (DUF72 family) [Samsonia erythrinae]